MELATAVVTAVFFAAFGFPFHYYQCWYSWGGLRTHLISLVYFALAGGGGGWIGWLIAQLGHATPTKNLAVNGFLYGAAGALTLRADFRPRRTPRAKMDVLDMSNAASLLQFGLLWTANALDDIAHRQMLAWLIQRSDDALIEQAHILRAEILQDRRVPSATKATLNERVVPAMELVRSHDQDDRVEGRAYLVTFCWTYLLRNHAPKLTSTRTA